MLLSNLSIFFPEIILLLSSLGFTLNIVIKKNFDINILFTVTFVIVALVLYLTYELIPNETLYFSNNFLVSTGAIKDFKVLILGLACFYIILFKECHQNLPNNFVKREFAIILMINLFGSLIQISANNFLAFYLAFELQSLSLALICALNRSNKISSEAAIKYFIFAACASGIMLFGISLIYGCVGNLYFVNLTSYIANNHAALPVLFEVGIIFFIIGILFKIAAVPFHFWFPDVMQGNHQVIVVFIATISKIAPLVFLSIFIDQILNDQLINTSFVIEIIAGLTLFVGALGALKQKNINRFFAYSSINNFGFLLLALNEKTVIFNYLSFYCLTTLGLFFCLAIMQKDNQPINNLEDIAGLFQKNPLFAFIISILIFSLIGIPPLAGFFAKFYILKNALNNQHNILAVIAIISSMIFAFCYLQVIKNIFFIKSENNLSVKFSFLTKYSLFAVVIFNLFYIFL